MSKLELKPCPLCGYEPEICQSEAYIGRDGHYFIQCAACAWVFGYQTDCGGIYSTLELAAKDWNKSISTIY